MKAVYLPVVLGFLLASDAFAGGWELVTTEPYMIRARSRDGSAIKDVWAEGELNASVQDIQATVMEADRFPQFMPYVKESRFIGPPEPDGSRFVYTRLALPVVSARDYVSQVFLDEGVKPDGNGEFKSHWFAVPKKVPEVAGTVRLKLNEGSWHVAPVGPSKSKAIYKFAVDPGGWIPGFAASMGNKGAVTDTFRAVEKEAQRRARERQERQAKQAQDALQAKTQKPDASVPTPKR